MMVIEQIESPKIGFRHIPVPLKLSIVWIYLISFSQLWNFVAGLIGDFSLHIISLIVGIVFLVLANGLVRRDNISRLWTIVCGSIGSLIRAFILVILVINDIEWMDTLHLFNYEVTVTKVHLIIFWGLALMVNAGVIFILLKSETSEIFSPQTTQQEMT